MIFAANIWSHSNLIGGLKRLPYALNPSILRSKSWCTATWTCGSTATRKCARGPQGRYTAALMQNWVDWWFWSPKSDEKPMGLWILVGLVMLKHLFRKPWFGVWSFWKRLVTGWQRSLGESWVCLHCPNSVWTRAWPSDGICEALWSFCAMHPQNDPGTWPCLYKVLDMVRELMEFDQSRTGWVGLSVLPDFSGLSRSVLRNYGV